MVFDQKTDNNMLGYVTTTDVNLSTNNQGRILLEERFDEKISERYLTFQFKLHFKLENLYWYILYLLNT